MPHRIDGRNFQRVADGGVGRRAAPLHQNAVLLAVANNVPDDQEVSGKAQLGDQRQLVLHLRARLVEQMPLGRRAIAFAHAFLHALGEKAVHRFALRHGIVRKLVAQIVEREFEPLAHDARVGNGLGNVAKSAAISRACADARALRASSRPALSSVCDGGWP
jgi:hypothetical protein